MCGLTLGRRPNAGRPYTTRPIKHPTSHLTRSPLDQPPKIQEVDSVELPYLNRARLAYTAAAFVAGGAVPGVKEANKNEPLLPWGRYHQVRVFACGGGGFGVGVACACDTLVSYMPPHMHLTRKRHTQTHTQNTPPPHTQHTLTCKNAHP
jgi:hypothetical protein